MVELAKGIPVYVPTREENGFALTPEDLARAITPNTKAVILNNPSNPTGGAYDADKLKAVVETALKEGLVIIADEIYEKLVYDGFKFTSVCQLGEKAVANSVIINGFSKAYSMTGWRLGWAVGPEDVISGMDKVQSHSTSNPCSIAQWAGVEALNGPQYDITRMQAEFQKRRNYMLYRLQTLTNVSCFQPQGAFYLFPNMSYYYDMEYQDNKIRNSYGLAYYLLKEAQVAIVPGAAFGDDKFIRLSYATSMERIKEAMDRIATALGKLTPSRKTTVIALNNTMTKVRDYVETESSINSDMRNALLAESDTHLKFDNYHEWNANIGGIILQLRTNSPHLMDFWMENWYPGQLETDLEPHGVIYAVKDVVGREARAFYNSESRTGFVFNTAYYGQIRSMALGIAGDIMERSSDAHLVHASCLDVKGKGTLIFAGPGLGKSGPIFHLLTKSGVKLVAYDSVIMRYTNLDAFADMPERKIYFKTKFADKAQNLLPLLDRSKCENVITKKDECDNEPCLRQDNCRLDKGKSFCYVGFKNSRAMLDPYWIGGIEKHARRSSVDKIIIFHKESIGKPVEELKADKALEILGAGKTGMPFGVEEHFFHPHLLVKSSERLEMQKRLFLRLLSYAQVYYINAEMGKDRLKEVVGEIVGI
jgi:histidinol-phosphate/aromatic aminotransferase/cobyric acid decarboxylase-like protein